MSLSVALWQGTSPPASTAKRRLAWAVAELETAASAAAEGGAHLLVLPELFLGCYSSLEASASECALRVGSSPELERVAGIARGNGLAVVLGFFELGADGRIYNSAMAVDADGAIASVYRKTHLYGQAECAAFTPGDELGNVFSLCGVRCGMLICYDVEFPETVRTLALAGASLVLTPTANMHPYGFVNNPIIRVRAYESHVHVVYSNWAEHVNEDGIQFNGQSIVADPRGKHLLELQPSDVGVFQVKLSNFETRTSGEGHEDDHLRDRRPELYTTTLVPAAEWRLGILAGDVTKLSLCLLAVAGLACSLASRGGKVFRDRAGQL